MHMDWTWGGHFLAANWQEIVGFLTGVVCVWLLIRQNIWNWPVGISNNIFYIFIFFKWRGR
jgi:nicotinamide mononucleotide transporter